MEIFLSHVSTEGLLALVLKEWIQTIFNGRIKVFVSSDIKNIAAGDLWLGDVRRALVRARLLVILCSPHSVTRPWVNFEAGCAWLKKIPVIPVCHSGQKPEHLPSPLFLFEGLDMRAPDFPEKLIQNLTLRARLRKHPKLSKKAKNMMKREIRAAIRRIPTAATVITTKPHHDKVAIILKKIATADDEDCTCSKLARSLKTEPNDLDVYLRHLMDREFITKISAGNGDCRYTTTASGRAYLVKQEKALMSQ
ncbi:MAG: toll/interleukin-1 receptor domain-containing protein [Chloroflexi bacterium]|nr:toll/interleukin-1 receptor domain-containing protein [Chloroflexota bacterium]